MSQKKYLWSVSAAYSLGFNTHELWELISSPNNLEKFHPFCSQNPSIKWEGAHSIDKIHYHGGKVLTRKFFEWNEGKGYKLLIGENDTDLSMVEWEISAKGSGSSLEISIYPYRFNEGPKFLNYLPFHLFIKPGLNSYLWHIGKGLTYYHKTGKSVQRNQFGRHKWFSP